MKPKQKLLAELIKSLNTSPDKWEFDEHVALNKEWGISLWISNIPMLNLHVWRPTEVRFSLIAKIKLYKAMNQCRSKVLLNLLDNINTSNQKAYDQGFHDGANKTAIELSNGDN